MIPWVIKVGDLLSYFHHYPHHSLFANLPVHIFEMSDGELRQGPLGTSIELWGRYSTIPYVEGTKYTIGQHFVSKERQGEFIYCALEGVSKGIHCELRCRDGSFYVKNKCLHGTLVNGEAVFFRKEKLLNFGDLLCLQGASSKSTLFYFTKRRYDKLWEGLSRGSSRMSSNSILALLNEPSRPPLAGAYSGGYPQLSCFPDPGVNSVVLHEIMKYLSVESLKGCRLVCHRWKDEASRVLKKRTHLRFDMKNSTRFMPLDSMHFFYYEKVLREWNHPRWSIYINPMFGFRAQQSTALFSKHQSDIREFFGRDRAHEHVRSLKLETPLHHPAHLSVLSTILANLGPHLQHLTLSTQLGDNGRGSLEGWSFPSLRSLHIIMSYHQATTIEEKDARMEWGKCLIRSLLRGSPRLTSITLENTKKPYVLGTLEELKIRPSSYAPTTSLSTLSLCSSDIRILVGLCSLPHPLSSLSLGVLLFTEESIGPLGSLLRRHAGSLRELAITVTTVVRSVVIGGGAAGQGHILVGPSKKILFKLPILPALLSLELRVENDGVKFSWGEEEEEDVGGGGGGGGCALYPTHFPSLRTLSILPTHFGFVPTELDAGWVLFKMHNFLREEWGQFTAPFFSSPTPCVTLSVLELPYSQLINKEPNNNTTAFMGRLAHLFPNVVNPYMEEWRNIRDCWL